MECLNAFYGRNKVDTVVSKEERYPDIIIPTTTVSTHLRRDSTSCVFPSPRTNNFHGSFPFPPTPSLFLFCFFFRLYFLCITMISTESCHECVAGGAGRGSFTAYAFALMIYKSFIVLMPVRLFSESLTGVAVCAFLSTTSV